MLVNQIYQGGIKALLAYDGTIFDGMSLPDGIELQSVVDHIIYKYGDAPLAVPDPAVVKYYITAWSARRLSLWERFKTAIELEYNPLENYDRNEDYTVEFKPGTSYEQQLSADNATTYQPDRKTIGSGTDTTTNKGHTHGNIGVTTSQQMLTSELDLIPRLDILDMIAEDWHQEFNLMMYN